MPRSEQQNYIDHNRRTEPDIWRTSWVPAERGHLVSVLSGVYRSLGTESFSLSSVGYIPVYFRCLRYNATSCGDGFASGGQRTVPPMGQFAEIDR